MVNEKFKTMTTDSALGVEKTKKKSKPAKGEAARLNGTQSENETSLQSEKKKKDKDKKIKHLQAQSPRATADVPVGEPEKKKKKKRKAASAEGEMTNTKATLHHPANAQGSVPDNPEKKRQRDKKSEQPSGQPELAAVGDRELARSGKPIVKALYTEHAAVAARTAAEVDAWRAERETVVTGRDMKPVMAFDEAGEPLFHGACWYVSALFSVAVAGLNRRGNAFLVAHTASRPNARKAHVAGFSADLLQSTRTFAQPSPIQAQCWPIIQSGNDLVGIAATGSGKTLAFGLPGLKHILAQKTAGVSTGTVSHADTKTSFYVLCHAAAIHLCIKRACSQTISINKSNGPGFCDVSHVQLHGSCCKQPC